MTIADTIQRRGISEVLHFTTNCGIVGTLATSRLLSRHRLEKEQYLQHVLHVNAANRSESLDGFDKSQDWLDYVNLSISEINRRYFEYSLKWHKDADIWWGILVFDPLVMTHKGVYFATTNNVYEHCVREAGNAGLEQLFQGRVQRKGDDWSASRLGRAAHLTTCEQAEVLYPEGVPVEFLRRIYVQEDEHHDQARGWLEDFKRPGVEVVINPEKFLGCKN